MWSRARRKATTSPKGDAMLVAPTQALGEVSRRIAEQPVSAGNDMLTGRLAAAGVKRLEAREHLFCEGDPAAHVYRIESGYLCIYKMMPDGRRQVVDFGYPGDLVGLGSGTEHVTSAHALGSCRVRAVPAPALHQQARQDAQLAISLYETLAQELEGARNLLLSCCQQSAVERLASFLVMLSRRSARKGLDAEQLFLPMTRSDIGDYLGLTIETVSRTFTKLKAMGLIELTQCTSVRIVDVDALERLAQGSAEN
jgi:CRP/FNR family transcriptional regulator